jgi:hypothetical protein
VVSSVRLTVQELKHRVMEFMGAMGTLGPIIESPHALTQMRSMRNKRTPCGWHPCNWFEHLQSLGEDTLDTDNKEGFLFEIITSIFDDYPCRVFGFVEAFIIMVVSKVEAAVVYKKASQLIVRLGPIGDAVFHSHEWPTHHMWSALDKLYQDVQSMTSENSQYQVGSTRPRSECEDRIDWQQALNATQTSPTSDPPCCIQ